MLFLTVSRSSWQERRSLNRSLIGKDSKANSIVQLERQNAEVKVPILNFTERLKWKQEN